MKKRIVRLNGGIGNQLFQLGFGEVVARECGCPVLYDRSGVDDRTWQKLERLVSGEILQKTCGQWKRFSMTGLPPLGRPRERQLALIAKASNRVCYQREFSALPAPLCEPKTRYFSGYFQDRRVVPVVLDQLSDGFNDAVTAWRARLNSRFPGAALISVHMRLGDYLTERAEALHGSLGHSYYTDAFRAATRFFDERSQRSVFVMFSNDTPAAKERFASLASSAELLFFADEWPAGDIDEFQAMTSCDAHIIANSTFSYWPAQLAEQSRIRIAPEMWFADERLNCLSEQLFDGSWLRV